MKVWDRRVRRGHADHVPVVRAAESDVQERRGEGGEDRDADGPARDARGRH